MAADTVDLRWSAQFHVAPQQPSNIGVPPGDKILLPPSALEQLLSAAPRTRSDQYSASSFNLHPFNPYTFAADRHARMQSEYEQQQLPYPLTFRLVNSTNNRVVYAGIREFSADEGTVGLSPFLAKALDISVPPQTEPDNEPHSETSLPLITVHAKQLPKGTFVKLRPLEAGYDPEDWKSLLEEYMRKNFTTLSKGEILTIPARTGTSSSPFQFLIDEFTPSGDGICVVDTDLEVDIEALNEEQARETLRRIAAKANKAPGTDAGSSRGGPLTFLQQQSGQIIDGDYVDYELQSWDRSQTLEIELSSSSDEDCLQLFGSPFSDRQRAKPRADEHCFGEFEGRGPKRLRLSPTNVALEDAQSIWIAVHAPAVTAVGESNSQPKQFTIRASPASSDDHKVNGLDKEEDTPGPDEVRCKNCGKCVPQRSLVLHENFCFRNNILCPQGCGTVFQKRSPEYENHWHCPHDASFGNSQYSKANHDLVFHTSHSCPNCNFEASSLPELSQHRTTTCPGKLILCQFCHLVVPQEGDPTDPSQNAEAILTGLTPHELADGARTTDCYICSRIVRMRDMATHLKHHELEKLDRATPRLCRNVNCGRTLDGASKSGDTRAGTRMGQGAGNGIGLCSTCFGPLYVALHDPEGKALKRRVERRYLSQMMTGCGKSWCVNEYCKTGRKNANLQSPDGPPTLGSKEIAAIAKPFIDGVRDGQTPLHFCVDETSHRRKGLTELLEAQTASMPGQSGYSREWCAAAIEAETGNAEKAQEWLKNFAPTKAEETASR